METLVVVAQHRNQYYNGGNKGGYRRFGSSPSGGFKDINCRTFESGLGLGLLPSPFKGYGSPVMNRGFVSPKVLTPCGKSGGKSKSENGKYMKKPVKSNPIPIGLKEDGWEDYSSIPIGLKEDGWEDYSSIPIGLKVDDGRKNSSSIPIGLKGDDGGKDSPPRRETMCFSELWAGPAYSNSPPPSSLPMPTFSLKPKRTVSLELPALETDLNLQPMPKSAPASPTRESARSSFSFLCDDDSATKTLRRILNLDIADD